MKKERIFDEEAKKSLPNFGLKRERGIIDHHLYKFYLALVANDFEQVKQIAIDHGKRCFFIIERVDFTADT
jgi:hypothetical protein